MAPPAPPASETEPRRRRGALLSLLVTVLALGAGAWFVLRTRATALPAYVSESKPGPGTTARPAPPGPSADPLPSADQVPSADPVPSDAPGVDASPAAEELMRVSGIGRRSADALVVAGVGSLEELATCDDARLVAALEAAGVRRSPTLSSWAPQARRLAAG